MILCKIKVSNSDVSKQNYMLPCNIIFIDFILDTKNEERFFFFLAFVMVLCK